MIHFAFGHFPIALLVTGAVVLIGALSLKHDGARSAAFAMLIAGAVFSMPTVIAGLWIAGEHQAHHADELSTHRLLGIATMVVAIVGTLSHVLRHRIANADLVRNLLFFTAAALSVGTGFVGAEMAHGTELHEEAETHLHSGDTHDENHEPSGETNAASHGAVDHGSHSDGHSHNH